MKQWFLHIYKSQRMLWWWKYKKCTPKYWNRNSDHSSGDSWWGYHFVSFICHQPESSWRFPWLLATCIQEIMMSFRSHSKFSSFIVNHWTQPTTLNPINLSNYYLPNIATEHAGEFGVFCRIQQVQFEVLSYNSSRMYRSIIIPIWWWWHSWLFTFQLASTKITK